MKIQFLFAGLILAAGMAGCFGDLPADQQPSPFRVRDIAHDLVAPVYVTHAGDDSNRIFIVERGSGRILVIDDGVRLKRPLIDLSQRIAQEEIEQGLLGLAFHPNHDQNGLFYVSYVHKEGRSEIVRFRTLSDNPNRVDPTSEMPVLRVDQPYINHNGGHIAFGPDGYLYIGFGDGGNQGDLHFNSQNTTNLLGALLRIDVNMTGGGYRIPPDNPFVDDPAIRSEIWAYGLRNPWQFTFDSLTGDLYIPDVGRNDEEEINFQPAGDRGGQNYGWPHWEGNQPYEPGEPGGNVTFPVYTYSHAGGQCAITGGQVYRGNALPGLRGAYLFADYCSGTIWQMRMAGESWKVDVLLEGAKWSIASFGSDQDGELYITHLGKITKIVDESQDIYSLVGDGQVLKMVP